MISALPARPAVSTESFLAQMARDLTTRYSPEDLSDLVVVVPTRRAVVYLKNELAMATDAGEALWSPRVAAMEDYMVELAGVQVEEPIALQLLLYDILKDIDPKLDFDRFVGWAGLLLEDFSSLDQNLAQPDKVFEYLSQAKALERWDLGEAPKPESMTAGYFKFWDDLSKVYYRLRRRMLDQRVAYPGLAYRRASERVAEFIEQGRPLARHVFLGLGFLSRAEERLIRLLLKEGLAEVRFDADAFYMEGDTPNRAGQHLRRYLKNWELPLEAFGGPEELLRGLPRHVRFVGVANASMQGKVAGQLLAEARTLHPSGTVAVVLPDETLLLPVLHGLPPDTVPDYNVTMGLSFQSTPLFNLVDLLFEVHLTGIREGSSETGYGVPRYHHLAVSKLLGHPFLRRYQQWLDKQPETRYHGLLDKVCREIVRRNAVLLPASELLELGQEHELLEALFKTWDTCDDIIAACYTLIDLLKQVYQEQHSAIEAEYLYLFYTLVKRLDSVFDCREQRLSVRSFRRFLYEQMTRTRLPFSGEPIADVQVMGLLETRALDFDHIILLSCNENVLPAPKRHTSLFPYDVLTEFRLPTYADHEAATAYHFWRLLQRARRVDLVHVLPGAEGTRTGERSRFLLQLQNDLLPQSPQMVLEDVVAVVTGPHPPAPSPVERGSQTAADAGQPFGMTSSAVKQAGTVAEHVYTADPVTRHKTTSFAKEMRKGPTPAENALWQALRNQQLGEKFRRQHVINSFIADFVCIAKMLVVEVDGDVHLEAEQAEYYAGRTHELQKLGYQVLRFANADVLHNLDSVLAQIEYKLQSLPSRVQPAHSSGPSRTEPVSAPETNITIGHASVAPGSPLSTGEGGRGGEAGDLVLEKDAGMLQALREVLDKGLSPTALNEYLACSLKFYFNRLARFRETDEVEEALGADGFGTVVHEALEDLLTPFQQSGKPLTAADIPGLIGLAPMIVAKALRKEEKDRHARADEGLNHVLGQVASQLVRRYLEGLLTEKDGLPLLIQEIEKKIHATVFVPLPDGERLPVRLTGIADRVDQMPNGDIRVVDYKTGLVLAHELKLQKRGETSADAAERLVHDATSAADKVRQLWLYRFMLAQGGRPAADTAIISLRNLGAGPMSADMGFLTDDGQDFMQRSEELLSRIINRILDPQEPIRKTDDLDKCQYCPYRGICAR
ncbi:PD-(D/E)XK nuclease family protein [Hymenobacter psychrotolerans]|uniref:Very-short-patch-repair endonuclease n=1 Tax=Hymenobacter psychrotolerans DSM 18569 TaxID=1121959 RepID=A0A1M6UIR9_9BACT|nr:PD-(D/E)XK nuclease family protein [Hymenobacter psychrotolerans]SHK69043.1 Very-short-patch-repair endonuclease [Hymenobacter psychrotolerans DSM 18569]